VKYMLDTNMCIFLIRKKSEMVIQRLLKCSPGEVGISSITLAELQYGVEKSRDVKRNREALAEFIMPLEIALFDEAAAEKYGIIRTELERSGQPIGAMDMLIGAHAASLGTVLVTNNLREFIRIKHLKTADWTE